MDPSFTFRPLRPSDAAQASEVHAQAFSAAWSEADIRDQLERADRVFTGAWRDADFSGFAGSRYVADEADLLTIVVDAGRQRGGIGTGLLGDHLLALSHRSVSTVFLEVAAGNDAARALYARFGFAPVGDRKAYYPDAGQGRGDAVTMRLAL